MMYQCVLAGVGGQGIVLASKLMATVFMREGFNVRTTETIGMAQRGGSVTSHLRASETKVYSPFVFEGSADLLLAFEPAEALRNLRFTGAHSKVLVHAQAIKPVTDTLSGAGYNAGKALELLERHVPHLYVFDFTDFFREVGTEKVLNIAMIGAATGMLASGFTYSSAMETMAGLIPEKHLELNRRSFETGFECGEKYIL